VRPQTHYPNDPGLCKRPNFQTSEVRAFSAQYTCFFYRRIIRQIRQRWPLILFLHGAGDAAPSLEGRRPWAAEKGSGTSGFPFIVVSPQCPEGQIWSNDTLLALLDETFSDTPRIRGGLSYRVSMAVMGPGIWA